MSEFLREVKISGDRNELVVNALFDSGASVSLVHKNVAKEIATLVKLPYPMKFQLGKSGEFLEVYERVVFNVNIDGKVISDEFFVADELSEQLILGVKTFQAWRIKLDFEKEIIEIGHDLSKLKLV